MLWIVFLTFYCISGAIESPEQSNCYGKLDYLTNIAIRWTNDSNAKVSCPLSPYNHNSELLLSSVETFQQYSEPYHQKWSICKLCGIENGILREFITSTQFQQIASSEPSSMFHELSWSQWHEFFFNYHNDQIFSQYEIFDNNNRYERVLIIDRPVYLLPMITFHIGHILVDVIESLYHSMLASYGRIRYDAILVFDVAGEEERAILQRKLITLASGQHDSPYRMLRYFTDSPLYDTQFFSSLPSNSLILFNSLHIGLEIKDTVYSLGFLSHPCTVRLSLPSSQQPQQPQQLQQHEERVHISKKYQQLQEYLLNRTRDELVGSERLYGLTIDGETTPLDSSTGKERPTILFIQRKKYRLIENLSQLTDLICLSGEYQCLETDIAELTFTQQLQLFQQSDLIVTVAGTALHNMIFIPKSVPIVILMQQGWCDYSWMYANQAVMLAHRPLVWCPAAERYPIGGGETLEYYTRQWSLRYWKQGPRMLKSTNVTVNVEEVPTLVRQASFHTSWIRNETLRGIEADNHSQQCTLRDQSQQRITFEFNHTIECYIAEITSIAINQTHWKVGIIGEIASTSLQHLTYLGETYPDLSICVELFDIDTLTIAEEWQCIEIHRFNYFAYLYLTLSYEKLFLHYWIQLTPTGGEDVIGTHGYMTIDSRLPDGGLSQWKSEGNSYPVSFTIQFQPAVEIISEESTETMAYYRYRPLGLHRYELQQSLSQHCYQYKLTAIGCHRLLKTYQLYRRRTARVMGDRRQQLPAIQHQPTAENPFIFIHIEKTAGTTIREFIYEAGVRLQVPWWIPCHGKIDCLSFHIPSQPSFAIIAGHISYHSWPRHQQDTAVTCLVIGRQPVDRVISYYYHRCYLSKTCIGYGVRLNDLSLDSFISYFHSTREARYMSDPAGNMTSDELYERHQGEIGDTAAQLILTDEGFDNAACRSMTNQRVTTGLIVNPTELSMPLPEPMTEEDYQQAVKNTDTCVVGLVEKWDETLLVLETWFPWLSLQSNRQRHKMKLVSNKETRLTLRGDLREYIESHSDCDMKLYEHMTHVFERQWTVINE